MHEINAWLNSDRDFSDGAHLYDRYGKNSFLKQLFKSGASAYAVKKLTDELEALAPEEKSNTAAKIEQPAVVKKEIQAPPEGKIDTKQHERYLQLKHTLQNKYRQLERNMFMLDESSDRATLHMTAKQILSLHAQISDTWRTLDHYDEYGRFPEVKPPPEPKSASETIQLLYQSISKAKRRLKSGKCRDVKQTEKLLEEKLSQLAQLQQSILNK